MPLVPAASVTPDRLNADDPELAPVTEPPQLLVRLGGLAIVMPAGRESVKPTPVRFDVKLFGLRIVMLNVEVPLRGIAPGLKALLITRATGVALKPTALRTKISTPAIIENVEARAEAARAALNVLAIGHPIGVVVTIR